MTREEQRQKEQAWTDGAEERRKAHANKRFECTKCHNEKPASEFYHHPKTKTGYQSNCKHCNGKVMATPRSIPGSINISITDRKSPHGFVNRSIAPIRFEIEDGELVLLYKIRNEDFLPGDPESAKFVTCKMDITNIERRSMDKLIDIHNAWCEEHGVTHFSGVWTKATNQINIYQMEDAA